MPEAYWLYEDGIGEARAALVHDDGILAARIELPGRLRVGTIARARLTEFQLATLDSGEQVMLDRRPPGLTLGAALTVEVVREAIPEPGRAKRARARPTDAAPAAGPDLLARITAAGHPVRHLRAHEADALEQAGWSETLDEALTGDIAFPGGALRMSPTPAMTLFDVDGDGALDQLAERAAVAVAQAIRRHDIGGSIGIDFPTITGKAPRQAVAAAIDAHLALPFERTAVNGFGFLQIVRPRPRASLPELLRDDPAATATRAALRLLERAPPTAPNRHRLSPAVDACLAAQPDWLAELVRRTGRTPILNA
ncbi:ribonuclease E/G [Sphingomonas sp. HHU CXW]|uniref:Ribonuclease E/G n=1 Tax=Sphingomonas hominis TaxID=2741495 RepID=A0ABX2JEI3_9SPHN|nr:ribonuclease E/G [Sphingomonas hominis]NTS64612.1 ribonuclease E/G [Sphingomonas hominis]